MQRQITLNAVAVEVGVESASAAFLRQSGCLVLTAPKQPSVIAITTDLMVRKSLDL